MRGNKNARIHHVVFRSIRDASPHSAFFVIGSRGQQNILPALQGIGSACVIVPPWMRQWVPTHHALLIIHNPKIALWRLVRWQRNQSRAVFVAITGSAGKTTTKEMIASIAQQKYPTLKTYKNNNLVGSLPDHVFRLNPATRVAVLEMSPPHINFHCAYARPKIGIVTTIGEAHIGKHGSLANLVRAKQQLIDGIQPGGYVLLNVDDPGSRRLSTKGFRGKVIRYGFHPSADFRATRVRFTDRGMHFHVRHTPYFIPTWGQHNVSNALAAIAAGHLLKIPVPLIQQGLRNFQVPSMRLQRLAGIRNYTLINDAYNANPTAAIAGLKVLKQMARNRPSVAVIGDMLELGSHTISGHTRVGAAVAKYKLTHLITVGRKASIVARVAARRGMPSSRIHLFMHPHSVASHIPRLIPPGAYIYFKASRGMKFEGIVRQLRSPSG
ncbi:UDP-N-acetylmuramoyl-tripeptide--D-alanyl-D-alanine ligase [Salinithrix halophila]|uniref:UDP-N-acetylmuramoyl-tripeptide--D-alanyl-D- alanine ligase n=1 Tax=Salinithrix halophila TaxID=1485204 RepID=UPI0036D22FD2